MVSINLFNICYITFTFQNGHGALVVLVLLSKLSRVATIVDFSTKLGKTKIVITNVEKRGFR